MLDAVLNILLDPLVVATFALYTTFLVILYVARWFLYLEQLREKRGLKNA